MALLRSAPKGFLGFGFRLGRYKPAKPNPSGNAVAFSVGAKSFKATNGATPELQRVMMLALKNAERLKKVSG